MGRDKYIKEVTNISSPIVVQELSLATIAMVDAAMIARLGKEQLAGIAVTRPILWVIDAFIAFIIIGLLSILSRSVGRKQFKAAKKIFANAIILGIVFSLIFTGLMLIRIDLIPKFMGVKDNILVYANIYLTYIVISLMFRYFIRISSTGISSYGNTKIVSKINIIINVLNIVLNYFFIFETKTFYLGGIYYIVPRLGLGVSGAAIATLLSQIVGAIIFLIYIIKNKYIDLRQFKLDKEVVDQMFKVGIPASFDDTLYCFGYIVWSKLLVVINPIFLSVFYIVDSIEVFSNSIGRGIAKGTGILIGKKIGEKEKNKIGSILHSGLKITSLIGATFTLVFIFFGKNLVYIMTSDFELIPLATIVYFFVGIYQIAFNRSMIYEEALRVTTATKRTFLINMIAMYCIRIGSLSLCIYIGCKNIYALGISMVLFHFVRYSMFWLSMKLEFDKYETIAENTIIIE
ncbi:MAG: MATE family efflux transporter [Clostridia bacterium]|jgi:putative MATE family efflux protein|nr:MATE family efflux transporter [Clostridia bacterium]